MREAQHLVGSSDRPRVGHDFYDTPAYCTKALLAAEKVTGTVWEPACGNGAIADLIPSSNVYCSDIQPRFRGESLDFLDDDAVSGFLRRHELFDSVDWIITNPPYSHAEEFVRRSCELAPHVALLLKLNFLEGQKRGLGLWRELPPAHIHVFSKRISFDNGDAIEKRDAGLLAYAWFVWHRHHSGPPHLYWIRP